MIIDIAVWIVISVAAAIGWQKGMFAGGKTLFNCFVVTYLAIYIAPLVNSEVASFIPKKQHGFLALGTLLILLAILTVGIITIWNKLSQKYVFLEHSRVMESMPNLNRIIGILFGGAAGYIIAGTALLTVSLLPFDDLLIVDNKEVLRKADSMVIANAPYRLCNHAAKPVENAKETVELTEATPESINEKIEFAVFEMAEVDDKVLPPVTDKPVLIRK